MSTKHVISLLATCATLVASPYAQAAEPDSDSETVVTGRLTEAETLELVRRVAQPVDGQLARFQKPVCVFRLMPGHSSGPCRAAIPAHAGPGFRSMPGHHSGACRAS